MARSLAPVRLCAALVGLVGALLAVSVPAVGVTASDVSVSAAAARAVPTNRVWERRIHRLVNKQRAAHGCRPLRVRPTLRTAAREHSRAMMQVRTMSHQLVGEPDLVRRVGSVGYRNWRLLGENVAFGYPTPRTTVQAWMLSEVHRENILNCRFRDTGVGVVFGSGVPWMTQDFGRR